MEFIKIYGERKQINKYIRYLRTKFFGKITETEKNIFKMPSDAEGTSVNVYNMFIRESKVTVEITIIEEKN